LKTRQSNESEQTEPERTLLGFVQRITMLAVPSINRELTQFSLTLSGETGLSYQVELDFGEPLGCEGAELLNERLQFTRNLAVRCTPMVVAQNDLLRRGAHLRSDIESVGTSIKRISR